MEAIIRRQSRNETHRRNFRRSGATNGLRPEERLEVEGAIEWQNVSFSYFTNGSGNGAEHPPYALQNINVKVTSVRSLPLSAAPIGQIHHDQVSLLGLLS